MRSVGHPTLVPMQKMGISTLLKSLKTDMTIKIRELEVFTICAVLGSICLTAAILSEPKGGFTVGFAMLAGMLYGACVSRVDVTKHESTT